jgi:short chain dehydrogenase
MKASVLAVSFILLENADVSAFVPAHEKFLSRTMTSTKLHYESDEKVIKSPVVAADVGESSSKPNNNNPDTKVCVITGASQGLGRAMALELARYGQKVVVNYYPGLDDDAQATVEEINGLGGDGFAVPADCTDPHQIKEMFETVVDHFGRVDGRCTHNDVDNPARDGWGILRYSCARSRLRPAQYHILCYVHGSYRTNSSFSLFCLSQCTFNTPPQISPCEQRRHHARQPGHADETRRMGSRDQREPVGWILHHARIPGACDHRERGQGGASRERCECGGSNWQSRPGELRSQQGGRDWSHQEPSSGARCRQRQGERRVVSSLCILL